MRGDQWLLFGHLIGVIILFGAIAIENFVLVYMLRARTVDELRAATAFAPALARMFPIAVVLILAFGVGLVAHSHEFKFGQGWIDIALGLVIVLTILGPTVQGRRTDHVAAAVRNAPSGPIPAELASRVRDPVLRTSALVSSWLAIGILFLMARQPDWTGSWLTVGVFGLIGLGASMIVGQLQPRAAEQPTLH